MDEFKTRARDMFSALDLNGNQLIERHEMHAALNELAAEHGVRMEDPRTSRAVLALCGLSSGGGGGGGSGQGDKERAGEGGEEKGGEKGENRGREDKKSMTERRGEEGVDFQEFWRAAATIRDFARAVPNTRVRRAFNALNADEKGKISRQEVEDAFSSARGFDARFARGGGGSGARGGDGGTSGKQTETLKFDAAAVALAAAVAFDGDTEMRARQAKRGSGRGDSPEQQRVGFKAFRDFCVHALIFSTPKPSAGSAASVDLSATATFGAVLEEAEARES